MILFIQPFKGRIKKKPPVSVIQNIKSRLAPLTQLEQEFIFPFNNQIYKYL
ncbi:hypothetical protein SAMN05421820_101858 [Pedobacter steynii]|uniref:Uncharacterized protein n=1 Tax=Pedobacter steynii TaxID=430522 RepID=A0A1G9LDX3_9SPHI|nr:hypothetical protein SAMN05421820_101858 [Pedobacter steynii]